MLKYFDYPRLDIQFLEIFENQCSTPNTSGKIMIPRAGERRKNHDYYNNNIYLSYARHQTNKEEKKMVSIHTE